MAQFDIPKKPVSQQDWHPAYIVYQLRLKGLSLRRLARLNGYAPTSGEVVNRTPFPKMERLVAGAIGVAPQAIWPSRYNADGTPKSGLHSRKRSTPARERNVEVKDVA